MSVYVFINRSKTVPDVHCNVNTLLWMRCQINISSTYSGGCWGFHGTIWKERDSPGSLANNPSDKIGSLRHDCLWDNAAHRLLHLTITTLCNKSWIVLWEVLLIWKPTRKCYFCVITGSFKTMHHCTCAHKLIWTTLWIHGDKSNNADKMHASNF